MPIDPVSPAPSVSDASATVVVLFRPGPDDIANLTLMADWGQEVVAVVNGYDDALSKLLPAKNCIFYIRNVDNPGLARALNQGLAAAMERGANYVLLLDQDSRPHAAMRGRLIAVAAELAAAGRRIGCVAPALVDRKLAGANVGSSDPHKATRGTLATSGTLIPRAAWHQVGPMWEDLFIDGIDHEWCFRARNCGFETVVSPGIVMEHDMGEGAINFFGRFKPIHRSAARHYFIVRNTLWLAGRSYIPLRWRASELLKLVYRMPVYLLFSADRPRSMRNLLRAFADGLRSPRFVSAGRFE
ncbi:MAG: glycosyltransferase [Candidatus Sphingomonas colombiensis]|nr:glycosyltransferase [Sphingomonas sp.]WEK44382.1 MAG: glycosyltransferase [Sphingomonas sp.]